jgi:arylsulfate sulfotransferase
MRTTVRAGMPAPAVSHVSIFLALVCLAGCADDGSDGTATTADVSLGSPNAVPQVEEKTRAQTSDIQWSADEAGVTPFIAFVTLTGASVADVTTVGYVVDPKPGSVSKPVKVTYSREALENQDRFPSDGVLRLPVIGLYAGHENAVSIMLSFEDCSTQVIDGTLTAAAYADPHGVYDHPTFIKSRAAGEELGFEFFAMKSGSGTPIVVDTDGEIRWVGTSTESSISSIFTDNGFVIGDQRSTRVRRLELDGTETMLTPTSGYRNFHHNIDPGRDGLLVEMDTTADREMRIAEYTLDGGFGKEWNFGAIFTEHMTAGGDDPALFVRPPRDWFHTNAATYDARDDSLIVSSRESFIAAFDYDTGAIKWLLGDPTKYWYTFPSLRAKALTLTGSGLYPIGQHALSITSDGLLLTFNAGNPSESQPTGAPRGETRTYSAVSAYRIDEATMTATEVWNFDYGQSLYSDHCGSAYEGPNQSILISYARADERLHARLVALNAEHQVVFDIQYDSQGCNTSWNAIPFPLDNLIFE